jgi:lipoprotein-releasing system permease protein
MYLCKYLNRTLNVAYFIAKKFIKSEDGEKQASKPVVKISILSIALGVFVMILTLSIVTGFKNQVRDKVIGFGSHVQIMQAGGGSIFETQPMINDHAMVEMLRKISGVKTVARVAYYPGIFQSKGDSVRISLSNGRDTFRRQKESRGVMFKGVDDAYDLSFFQNNLVDGRLLSFSDTASPYELLISRKVAMQMRFNVGDKIPVYFVHEQPFRRNFNIVGIFETGLDDFDGELAIAKLPTVQQISGWGVQSSISLEDTLYQDRLLLKVNANGGLGRLRFDWGGGFGTVSKHAFVPKRDTLFRVVTGTYNLSPYEESVPNDVCDTAYFRVKVEGNVYSGEPEMFENKLKKTYLDESGLKYSIRVGTATLTFEELHGKGTWDKFISGYEVLVDSWEDLGMIGKRVQSELVFYSLESNNPVDVLTIQEVYPDIFTWLEFLDINFSIIVILMIAISVITMGASLLVLILEKTSAIGLLKALGASDWTIRKVFLIQAVYLIFRGMLWGNAFGISVALLQMYFNIFPLDPQIYYLNAVPIEINWIHLLLLNVFTILVCVAVLVVPSYFITRIQPTESIKFS